MFTVKFLLQAELELTDACEWYEKRKPGLGKEFLNEIDHYVNLIKNNPLLFNVNFSEKYRFAAVKKFPYSIAYRIDDEKNLLFIISVFHQNRNPSKF